MPSRDFVSACQQGQFKSVEKMLLNTNDPLGLISQEMKNKALFMVLWILEMRNMIFTCI